MDHLSPAARRRLMQSVRRANTGPEERVARELVALGIRFLRNAPDLPGKPDIYVPSRKLVVFVNGCFWHGHGACTKGRSKPKSRPEYWSMRIRRNQLRDRRVTRVLRRRHGLSVHTVWECELRHGLPNRVVRFLGLEQH
jgi:DNA mismatch endonuclease (patch repair protein)